MFCEGLKGRGTDNKQGGRKQINRRRFVPVDPCSGMFSMFNSNYPGLFYLYYMYCSVADSGEGVCVDPGEKGAILETGGPGPLEKGKG
jgi:hypothetical protein